MLTPTQSNETGIFQENWVSNPKHLRLLLMRKLTRFYASVTTATEEFMLGKGDSRKHAAIARQKGDYTHPP